MLRKTRREAQAVETSVPTRAGCLDGCILLRQNMVDQAQEADCCFLLLHCACSSSHGVYRSRVSPQEKMVGKRSCARWKGDGDGAQEGVAELGRI